MWVISWFPTVGRSVSVKDACCWVLLMFVDELELQVLVVVLFFFLPVKSGSPPTVARSWSVLSFHPQGILMCLVPPLPRHQGSPRSTSGPLQEKARTSQHRLASSMMTTMTMTFSRHPVANLPRQVLPQPVFQGR